MGESADQIGARIGLALMLLNISRGTLSREAEADKSLVSRWLRGITVPRDHNMTLITRVIEKRVPGFNLRSWQLPIDAFERLLLGTADSGPATPNSTTPPSSMPAAVRPLSAAQGSPPPVDHCGTEQSKIQSAEEVGRVGQAYPGVYCAFRPAYRNTGEITADLIIIWQTGSRLFFQMYDPSFNHSGEIFILRHQLFFVGEDHQRADGLLLYLLNGGSGNTAYCLDGLMMTVANDRFRTPSASIVVLQRLGDLQDSGSPPPNELMLAIHERMKSAFSENRVAEIADEKIANAIFPTVGAARTDMDYDYVLRAPMNRSLVASEVELNSEIRDRIQRVREAFLPDQGALPICFDF